MSPPDSNSTQADAKSSRASPRQNHLLVFGSPSIEQAEIDEVVDCLKSGWLGTGPKVQRFEQMFRQYKSAEHAVAVNSCTAALHLSMLAVGIGPGDEVIVPTMTFAATAHAVIHAGGTCVFADCDRRTMNINPADIQQRITPRTRAIVPVHFAGRPCDMQSIMTIARRHQLKVIEDCAHAVEATCRGKPVGTFGDLGCFSFYVTKNVTTGEGGMVITNDEACAARIKVLALHGLSKDAWSRFEDEGYHHYQVVDAGYKYNMMDLQAALGIHQLARAETNWQKRRQIWQTYNEALKDLPVLLPPEPEPDTKHAHHLYTILLDLDRVMITRDQFLNEMTRRNIGVGVHYIALHTHPYFRERYGTHDGCLPNAEWVSKRTVSLPLSPKLTREEIENVTLSVTEILSP